MARKLFHATGILIVLIYRGLDLARGTAAVALWSLAAVLALLDVVRARYPAVQDRFLAAFRAILDRKDERGLNGSTLYFAGCALAVTLFPRDAASAGILALALGDSSAAIIGSAVRSPRLGRGSVAGSLACAAFATGAGALFFPFPVALAGGIAAAVLESVSGSKLDNLTMPIGTALVLHLLHGGPLS